MWLLAQVTTTTQAGQPQGADTGTQLAIGLAGAIVGGLLTLVGGRWAKRADERRNYRIQLRLKTLPRLVEALRNDRIPRDERNRRVDETVRICSLAGPDEEEAGNYLRTMFLIDMPDSERFDQVDTQLRKLDEEIAHRLSHHTGTLWNLRFRWRSFNEGRGWRRRTRTGGGRR